MLKTVSTQLALASDTLSEILAKDNTSGPYNIAMDSGYGIDFSATAGTGTSELLSDYEEGSFTPKFSDAITGGTTEGTGIYTKVGNQITVNGIISSIDTTGLTAGNSAYIIGFPYTSTASLKSVGNVWFSGSVATSADHTCVLYIQNNTTYARFFESPYSGTSNILKVSDFTDDAVSITFTATYIVT